MRCPIWVPFVQFKKREKHPWRSVNFSKVATFLKVTLLHGCFHVFKIAQMGLNRAEYHCFYLLVI